MTQEETLKRIEEDAECFVENADNYPDPEKVNTWHMDEICLRTGFIAGAKSERNKVLDEVISRVVRAPYYSETAQDELIDRNTVLRILTSLKVDL